MALRERVDIRDVAGKDRRLTRRIPRHFSKAAYHMLCLLEKISIIGVEVNKMDFVQDLGNGIGG